MTAIGQDSLGTRRTLTVDGKAYGYYSLEVAAAALGDLSRLPYSMKVLFENLLRFEDGATVKVEDLKALVAWLGSGKSNHEINYRPARVLMQDFTGVPCVVDLAAMRDAMTALGGDPQKINPLVPVDLVIDHSVMVDEFGTPQAFEDNMDLEYARNIERYEFLRWGSSALKGFRVVPPGTGICHQVNLEYLAQAVWTSEAADGATIAYPDTVVGTDSHTTMVNGLGVLGWGVGGIEAEAAMLGQPVSMLIPEVVGFKLFGAMPEGITATDLVLTVTQMLRKKGVVGRFVEFYGPGLDALTLADRATIANMAPEYGATCGFFPIDEATLDYMRLTGRDPARVALVKAYCQAQGLWRESNTPDPIFTDTLELDLGSVLPSLAGPRRPQDKVLLSNAAPAFEGELAGGYKQAETMDRRVPVTGAAHDIGHGDVVIAAITSCTNTSNPNVLVAAGLVARKAHALGLTSKPWVKTSLAPGSKVVTDYFAKSGLQADLDAMGFNLVGYGCTTCIGNSGPLPEPISDAINGNDIVAASVLSGNRNFEGRVSPDVRANYLASPPLVVAYAIAGSMRLDLTTEALGIGANGDPVFLKDIWPTNQEVAAMVLSSVTAEMFRARYDNVFDGDARWQGIKVEGGATYKWNPSSTYVQNPPYFEGMTMTPQPTQDIIGARPLAIFADSITTDHISPAGSIKEASPAGRYLNERQVARAEFNSYGARRGNHEVMMRGTFANIRIRNEMVPGVEGGVTKHIPSGEELAIFDAAERYKAEGTPLVVVAGKEYGTGSSRDWAAKGTTLLGVRAVIAESFERIHRSNLVGMGVLPLQFAEGQDRKTAGLDGTEIFEILGVADLKPRQTVQVGFTRADGTHGNFETLCRIDTEQELGYFYAGGILPYVLRKLAA
ncbi:aconitate hydratase AcnA [Polymorphobacter fuscus]|uniref:Aconitate hydratase n=1 Tax=Sandarakinorhabdus fusca TaxID=1439888 RepID=A0A7C9GTS8_9SPHN|nr:aconitate hydratase AcnA [Polymorphobacter fuscus]KAB7648999.1 aconitate hydratase AcnA [Polymorphobacter fuscus]MQT16598.1 aconitate hydratase AcnA [Polymorphobacter fuscus]NJC07112.1 aconitate hydratase [Polymorphobacter fuscus]